ncbi:hypothetical protein SAMN06295984_2147 [Sphingopyxis terrae subsp. ummariensis]|uniref:Uncharacterized protein n=1 Tax=Sphingopyxis terrae subsp. ummariensis TaxID=429001 RepID=A0A1Y6FR32_9SPHN|nr:hypothetical protein SAMN06295984_2147 [Sphingopyxis terrae subsp. ummariensis]
MQAGPDWLDAYPNLFGCLSPLAQAPIFFSRFSTIASKKPSVVSQF